MTVLRVDLRQTAADRPDGADGPAGTERDADEIVLEAVHLAQACDRPRFLVVDHAADLEAHQKHYVELLRYASVPTVCLAIGAPAAGTATGPGGPPSAQLALPQCLKPPTACVLWAPDPEYGTGGDEETDPGRLWRSVQPLAQLLEETHVFDALRQALGDVRHGVAVAAPHVLEHDLTDSARVRVWRQALESLCGREVHTALPASGTGEDRLPRDLLPLVGDEVPKELGDRVWCMPNGEADERRRACESALSRAQDVYQQVRSPFAWVRKETSRQAGLPDALADLADALAAYRKTAEECLKEGHGEKLSHDQRSRLAARGIDLPDVPEASREHVGPGLRDYTEKLIHRPMPLRSVAARLGALFARTAPAGSAARLGDLNRACPQEYVDALRRPAPFEVMAQHWLPNLLPGFLIAFVAGLWPGVGWGAGQALGLLTAGLTALMQYRRPNCTTDGRQDGGGVSAAGWYVVSGFIGALLGAASGGQLGLPLWAGITAVCLSAAALALLLTRQWTRAVDDWWERMRPEDAAPMWAEIEKVLSEAAVHDWMLAEARLHCANGARAVKVLLQKFAKDIEEYGAVNTADAESTAEPDLFAPVPADDQPSGAVEESPEDGWTDAGPDEEWEPWDWDGWADDPEPEFEPAPRFDSGSGTEPGAGSEQEAESEADDGSEPAGGDPVHEPSAGTGPSAVLVPGPRGSGDVPEEPPRPLELRWLTRESGDAGRVLVDTLVRDLADGVVGVLAGCWGVLENDPSAVSRYRVTSRVAEILDEERACLARDGAASPPRHAARREDEVRPGTSELFGIATDRVARVLAEGEAKPPQPLCSPSRKRMLSRDPASARTVRFAPEAAGRGAAARDPLADGGWDTTGDDIVWTLTGRFAGALRLVPLTDPWVRTVRSFDASDAADASEASEASDALDDPEAPEQDEWETPDQGELRGRYA